MMAASVVFHHADQAGTACGQQVDAMRLAAQHRGTNYHWVAGKRLPTDERAAKLIERYHLCAACWQTLTN